MTNEQRTAQKKELEHLLHNCPEVVSPSVAAKWMPFGKNRVYELIHTGELRAFNYRSVIVPREWLVDFYCSNGYRMSGMCKKHNKLLMKFFESKEK